LKAREPSARVAVLISGSGSNLQAIIDSRDAGRLDIDVAVVVSNKAGARGLQRARDAGIEAVCVPHADFPDRDRFDNALLKLLDAYHPDLVLLAGFMRILTPRFVSRYTGRLLNIHPSLLPLYPGLDTHRRAIESGDAWHGATVHFVTGELDAGPGIVQGRVPIECDDDEDALSRRVLAVEHRIYPRAVQLVSEGRVTFADSAAWLDGVRLPGPLQI
jgi:phosphoribosylglycinamide formyltransferase-1